MRPSGMTHSTLAQLQQHVDVLAIFEAVQELDDVWVIQHLMELDLRP